jgi:hypothetical protein
LLYIAIRVIERPLRRWMPQRRSWQTDPAAAAAHASRESSAREYSARAEENRKSQHTQVIQAFTSNPSPPTIHPASTPRQLPLRWAAQTAPTAGPAQPPRAGRQPAGARRPRRRKSDILPPADQNSSIMPQSIRDRGDARARYLLQMRLQTTLRARFNTRIVYTWQHLHTAGRHDAQKHHRGRCGRLCRQYPCRALHDSRPSRPPRTSTSPPPPPSPLSCLP